MKKRALVPEVLQVSAMDCGPAALKALFAGFGVYLSYGRLREACQTDVDGTSIDTVEELAQRLGLEGEQSMMPVDMLLRPSAGVLPAIVVTRLPDGATHFVVVWSVRAGWVQVMDPAAGRLFIPKQRFLETVHVHEQDVPRELWDDWSRSAPMERCSAERSAELGVDPAPWDDRAHQDATLRLLAQLRGAGVLAAGEATRALFEQCRAAPEELPPELWTARPCAGDSLRARGAVVLGARRVGAPADDLPATLARIRSEPPPDVWGAVRKALRASGLALPLALGVALVASGIGVVIEALLFRSLLDVGGHLALGWQRAAALAAVVGFASVLLALEWPVVAGWLHLGRQLEVRLRVQLAEKIPRLADRYFQSRLLSDMAARAHSLELLRHLPEIAVSLVRLVAMLAATIGAIAWLYPESAALAALLALATLGIPVLFLPALIERDLRVREVAATLGRFYVDALLGSRALQAHGAAGAFATLHSAQLARWAAAALRYQTLAARADWLQTGAAFAIVGWLVWQNAATAREPAGLLLLVYWAVAVPLAGRQYAQQLYGLPALRSTLLRFLEPLGAPEPESAPRAQRSAKRGRSDRAGQAARSETDTRGGRGARIEIADVSVVAGGQTVLDRVSLAVESGEHVAIVGPSGAGKSALVGLLLGWHELAAGSVRVDGDDLGAERLAELRENTAWVDAQIHLFASTLLENVRFGRERAAADRVTNALATAEIERMLERMPQGLQTNLGEGGTLVSGGEGQQVRIARACLRDGARLAILDEPGRGLARDKRRALVRTTRERLVGATLLCVTHDIEHTLSFPRVVVVDGGRVVENGDPSLLAADTASRYRALLDQESRVQRELWADPAWRRWRLADGALRESTGAVVA